MALRSSFWLFRGNHREKKVAWFNQGNFLAGWDGSTEGHGALGIAMNILERTDLVSQVDQK